MYLLFPMTVLLTTEPSVSPRFKRGSVAGDDAVSAVSEKYPDECAFTQFYAIHLISTVTQNPKCLK